MPRSRDRPRPPAAKILAPVVDLADRPAPGSWLARWLAAYDDPGALEELLRRHPKEPRLVCMDGVNSMTGNPPQLGAFAALAREHDALLYLDDAHGFGVIGERSPDEPCPYGRRGNGVVRHLGETYEHVVLTAGFPILEVPLSDPDDLGRG
jgi:hypothetical protein